MEENNYENKININRFIGCHSFLLVTYRPFCSNGERYYFKQHSSFNARYDQNMWAFKTPPDPYKTEFMLTISRAHICGILLWRH
jgi:hypothetical protein